MDINIDIFVSYSSKDKAVADALVHFLEGYKCRCWYAPRDIKPGSEYADSISDAIESARFCVFIVSADSAESMYCRKEINWALHNGRTVIPFRIEEIKLSGSLGLYLNDIHWIDAFPEPEKLFGELLARIGMVQPMSVASSDMTANVQQNDPLDRILVNVDAPRKKQINRFVRWLAHWQHEIFMRVTASIDSNLDKPTHADLIACIESRFAEIGTKIKAEQERAPSVERFLSVCDKLSEMVAISYDKKDFLYKFSPWFSCGLGLLAENPKGVRGWYDENETTVLARGIYEVFRLVYEIDKPLDTAVENCNVKMPCPLWMKNLPAGVAGERRVKDMIFGNEEGRYRFDRNVIESYRNDILAVQQMVSQVPRDMPLVVEFDEEWLMLQCMANFNADGEFLTDVAEILPNLERNKRLLKSDFDRVWKRLIAPYVRKEVGH